MACYAALASLTALLEDIVHRDRYPKLPLGRQHILKSLLEKFSNLQGLWQDYSSEGIQAADHVGRQIQDAAYKAQDIIEFEISNRIESELSWETHLTEKILHQLISICQNASCLHLRLEGYEEELRKVEQEVGSIVEELTAIKESQASEDMQQSHDSDAGVAASQPTPIRNNDIVVGLEEYEETMLDLLTAPSSHLQVIPIVGMGGIGKTTLARRIFEHRLIIYYFDHRAWVTISQDYDLDEVLRSIVGSTKGLMVDKSQVWENYKLKEIIYKSLKGRRYLIVIDDIWNTRFWDEMQHIFPDDCNGSRIILTTRLSNVAHYVSGSAVFFPSFLSKDQSWDLLKHIVFGDEHCPPELKIIGRVIASKCNGLPLAIHIIAGILSKITKTAECWEMIARDVNSMLSSDDENLSKILSLSYNSLSNQQKACFLYMVTFPEDYEINVSKLLKLWIAEGFLKSVDVSKTLEQVGKDCLMDLVLRNLVIVTEKKPNGDFKFCKMHDLVRDFFGQRAFVGDYFHVLEGAQYLYNERVQNARHIIVDQTHRYFVVGKCTRTMFWVSRILSLDTDTIELDRAKLLRVLSITTTWAILDVILRMFHLKYLELRLNSFEPSVCLPPSISALQNLQTLIISSPSFCSITLPHQIWKMTQLNHLIIDEMTLPPIPMVGTIPIQKLECLQTLMTVIDFIFTNDVIEVIPNLRKLKIRCIRNEDSDIWELYCLDNLVRLRQLEELNIMVYAAPISQVDTIWSSFSFVFPLNLRKLSLGGCKFSWEGMTLVGSLPNLQVLKLRKDSFVGDEWEPTKGEFAQLKFLLMECLDLKYWRAENHHFPCLEHLTIKLCFQLEGLPSAIGEITTLNFIDIYKSEGAAESVANVLVEQQRFRTNKLQVHVQKG